MESKNRFFRCSFVYFTLISLNGLPPQWDSLMVYKSCQDLSARLFSKVGEEKSHYVTLGVVLGILFLWLRRMSMYLV